MQTLRVPSDVVMAIFHYLGSGKRFSADIPKIHSSFYEICQIDEFKSLCNDFVFDTSKTFPYSSTIRYALDNLQKADLLACRNPSLDQYEISDALAGEAADIEELFNETERTLLMKASKLFEEKISA